MHIISIKNKPILVFITVDIIRIQAEMWMIVLVEDLQWSTYFVKNEPDLSFFY